MALECPIPNLRARLKKYLIGVKGKTRSAGFMSNFDIGIMPGQAYLILIAIKMRLTTGSIFSEKGSGDAAFWNQRWKKK